MTRVEEIEKAIELGHQMINTHFLMCRSYKKLGSKVLEDKHFKEACDINSKIEELGQELKERNMFNCRRLF